MGPFWSLATALRVEGLCGRHAKAPGPTHLQSWMPRHASNAVKGRTASPVILHHEGGRSPACVGVARPEGMAGSRVSHKVAVLRGGFVGARVLGGEKGRLSVWAWLRKVLEATNPGAWRPLLARRA